MPSNVRPTHRGTATRSWRFAVVTGLVAVFASGLVACGSSGGGDTNTSANSQLITYRGEDREAKLVKCAKEEGRVAFWTSLSAFPDSYKPAFERAYPGVKVDVLVDQQNLAQKLATTEGAGKHDVDLLADTTGKLKRDDTYFQKLYTPRIDELKSGLATDYSVPFTGYVLAVAYNTDVIPPSKAPKTWQDLIKPEYKGKVYMATGISPIILTGLLNELYGEKFLEKFANAVRVQDVSLRAIADQVIAGTDPIGLPTSSAFYKTDRIENKAPFGFSPMNPSFASYSDVSISKNAPHPCAAALMLDWLLADDGGQKVNQETGSSSPLMGVDPVPFKVEGAPDPSKWEIIASTDPKLVDKYGGYPQALEAWSKLFNEKFLAK